MKLTLNPHTQNRAAPSRWPADKDVPPAQILKVSDFLLAPIQQPKSLCSTLLRVTCLCPSPCRRHSLFGHSTALTVTDQRKTFGQPFCASCRLIHQPDFGDLAIRPGEKNLRRLISTKNDDRPGRMNFFLTVDVLVVPRFFTPNYRRVSSC